MRHGVVHQAAQEVDAQLDPAQVAVQLRAASSSSCSPQCSEFSCSKTSLESEGRTASAGAPGVGQLALDGGTGGAGDDQLDRLLAREVVGERPAGQFHEAGPEPLVVADGSVEDQLVVDAQRPRQVLRALQVAAEQVEGDGDPAKHARLRRPAPRCPGCRRPASC